MQREKLTHSYRTGGRRRRRAAAGGAHGGRRRTEAQVLMVVVPEAAEMTAEVSLENKDIGFVHTGQRAAIKLDTFPFTRYGTIDGEVTRVTADAVNDEKRGAVFPAPWR